MAPRDAAPTGQKRGPGRPPKSATIAKRQKISASTPSTHPPPAVEPVDTANSVLEKKIPGLPAKVVDSKPLPTLPEPQPLLLANEEYQSIAASAVLPSSLDRSRSRWVSEGVFDRYWVKPETGKHAKPPRPNNPELKWMKLRGPCRIRIEPHIFEADVFVEEKVKPQPPPKQYIHAGTHLPYGQPYRSTSNVHQPFVQPYQNRGLPPVNHNAAQQSPTMPRHIPAAQQPSPVGTPPPRQMQPPPLPPPAATQQPAAAQGASTSSPGPAQQPDKKPNPDPVISMLASRASSDPALKALMKEVATGNASQPQLQIFQRHIDELTTIVQKQRDDEEKRAAKAQQPPAVVKYDAPAQSKPARTAPIPPPPQPQHAQPKPYQHPQPIPPQPPPPVYRQPTWTPPAPTSLPVILAFTTPGATEDRFLFPQYSILESLSPQHTLVSFIVTRTGREAADIGGLDPEKEYWQPVTMMVEVMYGREEILACIRRWAKPADEVRKHMEDIINRCERAPRTYLALRLPFKSTITEADSALKESVAAADEKPKSKPGAKYVKKATPAESARTGGGEATSSKSEKDVTSDQSASNPNPEANPNVADPNVPNHVAASEKEAAAGNATADTATATNTSKDTGDAKRPLRKSVRISETG